MILNSNVILYRATIIEDLSELKTIKRLSYKPASSNKYYARASTPYNTMFYAISANSHSEALMGALEEVCPCLRNANPKPQNIKVVLSQWKTQIETPLVEILNLKGYNKSSVFSNQTEFNELISYLPKNDAENFKQFWDFINSEFKKQVTKESEYWISSIFTEFLTNNDNHKLFYNGIIYESVQAVDPQLKDVHCIALRPSFVDNHLEFHCADLYSLDFKDVKTSIQLKKIKHLISKDNKTLLEV